MPPIRDLPLDHPDLHRFLQDLGGHSARIISRQPTGPLLNCFWNVYRERDQHGGQMIVGWRLSYWPRLYLEATHHGVWLRPDGVMVDVTPQCPGATGTSTTFVVDESLPAPTDWPVLLENRMLDLGGSQLTAKFFQQYRAINALEKALQDQARTEGGTRSHDGGQLEIAKPSDDLRRRFTTFEVARAEITRLQGVMVKLHSSGV